MRKPPEGGFTMLDGFRIPALSGLPYFNEVLIESNLVFRLLPRPLTTTMIAIEMPAAMRPYSMAVAPLSSERNLANIRFIG